MIYVWQASWRPNVTREESDGALMRRAEWQYPEGVNVLGEYWLSGSPAVILIFETDNYLPIMELGMTWGDVFEIVCTPATTPSDGLRYGAEIMERRPA
jgi:Domain of unknown function (DUF3303)